ncbi:MAG: hypothetical protein AB7K04_00505 [Pseudorhodoplanes sp.]
MSYSVAATRGRPHRRRRAGNLLALPVALFVGMAVLAVFYVGYILWPRWPGAVNIDAPSLPVTVADVTFNVPPAAIRSKVQRRPGTQERLDLVFLWPSLAPPDPNPKAAAIQPAQETDRVFLSITASEGSLPPDERAKTIYPRYLDTVASPGPDGLAVRAFRPNTPYQGEDLVYDAAAAHAFVVRCTRSVKMTPGTCLYDRRIGGAEIVLRFPRDWLTDWRNVSQGIERLIASLKSGGA